MKRTYEKPQLQTEPFDVQDSITVSLPDLSGRTIPQVGHSWEIPGFSLE